MPEGTSWPEAAIAIVGVAAVFGLIMLVVWQALATWRARMLVAREEAYRRLAQEATDAQAKTAETMEETLSELGRIREATDEMRRLLAEVE